MCEILFRGKRIDNGEWVYGWYCKCSFGRWPLKNCIIKSKEAENGCVEHIEVVPYTISQYTGIKDMNGIKIFEGDILKDTLDGEEIIACVEYRENCFGLLYQYDVSNPWSHVLVGNDFHPIVIGNIYDNPELASRIK